MSISEDIALDVADLPAFPFDVEGPVANEWVASERVASERVASERVASERVASERVVGERELDERGWEGAPSRTAEHGIDDASPPTSAPASHPLLDGS